MWIRCLVKRLFQIREDIHNKSTLYDSVDQYDTYTNKFNNLQYNQ